MSLTACLKPAALALSFLLPLPAMAGGGAFSIHLTPRSADEARALNLGLALFSVHQGLQQNQAEVRQNGRNNAAGVAQRGWGSNAVIHQEGNNHSGIIEQNGAGHAYGLFQFGNNARHHAVQNGRNQSGLTLQWGW